MFEGYDEPPPTPDSGRVKKGRSEAEEVCFEKHLQRVSPPFSRVVHNHVHLIRFLTDTVPRENDGTKPVSFHRLRETLLDHFIKPQNLNT